MALVAGWIIVAPAGAGADAAVAAAAGVAVVSGDGAVAPAGVAAADVESSQFFDPSDMVPYAVAVVVGSGIMKVRGGGGRSYADHPSCYQCSSRATLRANDKQPGRCECFSRATLRAARHKPDILTAPEHGHPTQDVATFGMSARNTQNMLRHATCCRHVADITN